MKGMGWYFNLSDYRVGSKRLNWLLPFEIENDNPKSMGGFWLTIKSLVRIAITAE